MNTFDIRKSFLEFFQSHGHYIEKSSPIVPINDDSLFFTNSGMVQFKNIFTGKEERKYTRATTAQKCVRASGKHNDLEQVGYTPRHHTFFEMLGNFSFGDYFKEEAILLAWNLLTKVYGIDKSKLLVTVYHTDEEAYNLWKKIAGMHDDQIIKISTQDNFWSMGDTGPCGPCSEIFYDHGAHLPGGKPGAIDEGGDRFVEIWNIVFMQFEKTLTAQIPLLKKSIDTGMGIERMAAVLQGTHDNFNTDIFKDIINLSMKISGDKAHIFSHRIIADHIRSIAFLIADGVSPSNDGRGYVLRRILRRALKNCNNITQDKYFLTQLLPVLYEKMSGFYPEITMANDLIIETIKQESDKFNELLIRGMPILKKYILESEKENIFPGQYIFNMYDTYGFPIDIIRDELSALGMQVDDKGFINLMQKQKEESRLHWKGSGSINNDEFYMNLAKTIEKTVFIGYKAHNTTAKILSIIEDESNNVEIVLDQSVFYAESGGQIYDTGIIVSDKGTIHGIMHVESVTKNSGLFVHKGKVEGRLIIGDTVNLNIDIDRRKKITANHSATHLLQAALKNVIGNHVSQKGSNVTDNNLRFDFNNAKGLTIDEINAVERIVNEQILLNLPVTVLEMPHSDAIKIGATTLFGEKYDDIVRVVSMGNNFSIEFCGGTHVNNTADIGVFKIISASSLSSGIRRIEAVTGITAFNMIQKIYNTLNKVCNIMSSSHDDIVNKISKLLVDNKSLKKMHNESSSLKEDYSNMITKDTINDIDLYYLYIKDKKHSDLLKIMDNMKKNKGIMLIINTINDKASILLGSSIMDKNAIDLLNDVMQSYGDFKVGGRKDLAQSGCNISMCNNDDILKKIKTIL